MTADRTTPSRAARRSRPSKPVILVTGAGGQLGRATAAGPLVVTTPRSGGYTSSELDIRRSSDAVGSIVETIGPDVIVNAAAYTAVDRAEDEPEEAEAVNVTGGQDAGQRRQTTSTPS